MDYELALIDMDGTVYSGNSPVEGANRDLETLRENVDEIFFLTNYAGTKREAYSEKLERMGINASSEDVVTSGWITAKYLSEKHGKAEVFVLGEEDLKEELRDEGLMVQEECIDPDVLVVSNKHDLEYNDLKQVLQGINEETRIIGTNPDETIPGDDGEIPGTGTIVQAVEAMTGKNVEIIGKPSENAVNTVTEIKDTSADRCIMIGDRLNTDILMGNQNDMETVLVLTGVTDEKEAASSEIKPDHVIKSIAEIDEIF